MAGRLEKVRLTHVDDVILERQQHSPQTSGEVLDEVHEEHVSDVVFEVREPISVGGLTRNGQRGEARLQDFICDIRVRTL